MDANALATLGRVFDRAITPVLMNQSVGRQLLPKNMAISGGGIGNTSVLAFGYVGTADAVTEYNILENFADTIDLTESTIKIPIQQDMVRIPRRTFETMKSQGLTPDADYAIQMAKKVSAALDKTVIQGWKSGNTSYEVNGFFKVAGLSHSGFDFGTYGGALKTVGEGVRQLMENKIFSQGYNLVLHPEQYNKLLMSESAYGMEELPKVLRMMNQMAGGGEPGQIYVSDYLEPGTGFMAPVATPANQIYFDLIEAQQPKHYLSFVNGDTDLGDILMRQIGAAVPRFKYLDSEGLSPTVCKFTALGG